MHRGRVATATVTHLLRRATVTRRGGTCAAVVAAVLLLPGAGRAAPPTVSVLRFPGPGEAEVHEAVTRTLTAHKFRLVPREYFEQTAARLLVSPAEPEGMRAVAAELDLAAVVTGQLTVRGRTRTARIAVRDPQTGAVTAQASFSAGSTRALARAVAGGLWRRLGPAIQRVTSARRAAIRGDTGGAQPGAAAVRRRRSRANRAIDEEPPYPRGARRGPEAAAPEASPEVVAAPAPQPPVVVATAPRPATGPATVELSIGPRLLFRQLSYDTDPDGALTPFRTGHPAPALGLEAAWFPRLTTPRLGLAGGLEYGAPLSTRTSGDLSYQLPHSDLVGSLLVGYAARLATIDLALGAGRQRFGVVPEGAALSRPRAIPDVTYRYLRAGLAARFYTHSRFGLSAAAYYRHVLSVGGIASQDWFPSSSAHGAEGRLGVSYRFLPALEARLHGEVRLYRLAMDPNGAGGHVTSGAVDQYWTAWLAMAVLLGGDGERR